MGVGTAVGNCASRVGEGTGVAATGGEHGLVRDLPDAALGTGPCTGLGAALWAQVGTLVGVATGVADPAPFGGT
ncbi:MAG: hypothetical protein ACRDNS_31560, partial [Trebonia sp.]